MLVRMLDGLTMYYTVNVQKERKNLIVTYHQWTVFTVVKLTDGLYGETQTSEILKYVTVHQQAKTDITLYRFVK